METNSDQPNETPSEDTQQAVPPQPHEPNQGMPNSPEPIVSQQPQKRGGKKGIFAALILVLVIAAGVAGYFAFASDTSTTTKTVSTSTKQTIPQLRVGMYNETLQANYPKTSLESSGTLEITSQAFEGLVRFQDINKIQPLLATGWTNPDSSTWVFNLKQGVLFHTGKTMTAQDVKASIDQAIANKNDTTSIYTETIKSVEIVDTNKIKITTFAPDPILLNRLAYIYIYDTTSATPDSAVNGTGPFTAKASDEPQANTLEYKAFDKYHGGKVYVRNLTFINYEDSEQIVKDFNAGKLDITPDVANTEIAAMKSKTVQIYTESGGATGMIGMTLRHAGPTQNKKFRQAVQYIMDKPLYLEKEELTATPASQLIPQEITGYNPTIQPIQQNVEKAKQLLAEAGVKPGTTLTLMHSDSYIAIDEIVKQFAAAGLTIVPQPTDSIDNMLAGIKAGQSDLYLISYASNLVDGIEFLTQVPVELANYQDPAYLSLLEKINTEFTASQRLSLLQQAEKQVSDEALILPVYSREYKYPVSKPYVMKQDIGGSIRGIYYYKVYAKGSSAK